jgi:pimeloyl-ACP methyl ester carboxylesterase
MKLVADDVQGVVLAGTGHWVAEQAPEELLAALTAFLAPPGLGSLMSAAQPSAQPGLQPTVVLVHGAFADASSWNGVIERLQQQGCTVVAPANPLRGLAPDSAYIASVVNQIDGPVLLVGHSYGGAVITSAAATATGVVGLVFAAAFAPTKANAWERSRPAPPTASSTQPWSSASTRPARTRRRRWSSPSTPPCSARRLPPTCPPSRPR